MNGISPSKFDGESSIPTEIMRGLLFDIVIFQSIQKKSTNSIHMRLYNSIILIIAIVVLLKMLIIL